MKKQRLEFHTDSGHGWMKVPMGLVKQSGVVISLYSYQSLSYGHGVAYLEEDLDLGSFVSAVTGLEGQASMEAFNEQFDIVEIYDGDRSPIRLLPAYGD